MVRSGGNSHVGWCLSRYRSYNPATNRYLTYGGVYRGVLFALSVGERTLGFIEFRAFQSRRAALRRSALSDDPDARHDFLRNAVATHGIAAVAKAADFALDEEGPNRVGCLVEQSLAVRKAGACCRHSIQGGHCLSTFRPLRPQSVGALGHQLVFENVHPVTGEIETAQRLRRAKFIGGSIKLMPGWALNELPARGRARLRRGTTSSVSV